MKRHAAALIVISVAALLNLGLGSRADGGHEPTPESCKTDLGYVFDWCGSRVNYPCRYAFDNFDACQAGCVKHFCPEQISCTELDPIWCEIPCEDVSGATFWADMHVVQGRCRHLHDDLDGNGKLDEYEYYSFLLCTDAESKKLCPAVRTWRDDLNEEEKEEVRRRSIAPGTPSPAQ